MVLRVLSKLWRAGAEIKRLPNGELELKAKKTITDELLQEAENEFSKIDEWYKSVEGSSKEEQTMFKIYFLFCGWQHNEVLNKWLCQDLYFLDKVDEWLKALQKNGMRDVYEDFRAFQSEETYKLSRELFEGAVAYTKGVKRDG